MRSRVLYLCVDVRVETCYTNRVLKVRLADPVGTLSPVEGVYLGELAWQQSFADGKAVFLAGILDQANYLDANAYANDQFAHFNEYVIEVQYRFQLTATTVLKPDLQAIWNPVNNPEVNSALVLQLALVTTW